MKQLENDLLKRLSSHQGDILEDTHLIGVLADTKETTKRVAVQLKEASVTKRAISETCEKYRPCAKVAALLYFALCDFARLNHMCVVAVVAVVVVAVVRSMGRSRTDLLTYSLAVRHSAGTRRAWSSSSPGSTRASGRPPRPARPTDAWQMCSPS